MKKVLIVILIATILTMFVSCSDSKELVNEVEKSGETTPTNTPMPTNTPEPEVPDDELNIVVNMINQGDINSACDYMNDNDYISCLKESQAETISKALEDFLNNQYEEYSTNFCYSNIYFKNLANDIKSKFDYAIKQTFIDSLLQVYNTNAEQRAEKRTDYLNEYAKTTVLENIISEFEYAEDINSLPEIADGVLLTYKSKLELNIGDEKSEEAYDIISLFYTDTIGFLQEHTDDDLYDILNNLEVYKNDYQNLNNDILNHFFFAKYKVDCIELIDKYDYSTAIKLSDKMISVLNLTEEDSIFKAKSLFEKIKSTLSKCTIVHDEFDDYYTIYFKNLQKITSQNNIIPFYNKYGVYVRLGFHASNWVFFEKVTIKTGEDEYIRLSYSYNDVTREVKRGVYEYIDDYLDVETGLKAIIESEKPIIRFEGDDYSRDHTITKLEKDAIIVLCELYQYIEEVEDLLKGKK